MKMMTNRQPQVEYGACPDASTDGRHPLIGPEALAECGSLARAWEVERVDLEGDGPAVGQEWAYYLREDSRVERVRIDGVHHVRPARYDVRFLSGENPGKQLNVPRRRLQVQWAYVDAFEVRRSNWSRVESIELTDTEKAAIEAVFRLVVPHAVADPCASLKCTGVTRIWDRLTLERLTGVPTAQLVEGIEWFEDDSLIVSAEGGLRIAEALCQQHTGVVLEWVHKTEERRRIECRHGAPAHGRDGPTQPETEWQLYRDYDRHVYELIRQWCGHRAISARERLIAAEEEAHRLDKLLTRCLTALAKSQPDLAAAFERERDLERVTTRNVRPMVVPPLPAWANPQNFAPPRRRWSG